MLPKSNNTYMSVQITAKQESLFDCVLRGINWLFFPSYQNMKVGHLEGLTGNRINVQLFYVDFKHA